MDTSLHDILKITRIVALNGARDLYCNMGNKACKLMTGSPFVCIMQLHPRQGLKESTSS